jgi:hypothetical protein
VAHYLVGMSLLGTDALVVVTDDGGWRLYELHGSMFAHAWFLVAHRV